MNNELLFTISVVLLAAGIVINIFRINGVNRRVDELWGYVLEKRIKDIKVRLELIKLLQESVDRCMVSARPDPVTSPPNPDEVPVGYETETEDTPTVVSVDQPPVPKDFDDGVSHVRIVQGDDDYDLNLTDAAYRAAGHAGEPKTAVVSTADATEQFHFDTRDVYEIDGEYWMDRSYMRDNYSVMLPPGTAREVEGGVQILVWPTHGQYGKVDAFHFPGPSPGFVRVVAGLPPTKV